jgi:hypothetical protein
LPTHDVHTLAETPEATSHTGPEDATDIEKRIFPRLTQLGIEGFPVIPPRVLIDHNNVQVVGLQSTPSVGAENIESLDGAGKARPAITCAMRSSFSVALSRSIDVYHL